MFYSIQIIYLNPRFIEAHRNCYSQKTAIGVLYGRIRSNLDVECSSQIFYNIRRLVINETKKEDLESLLQSLEKGNEKRVKVYKNSGILESITIIDEEILKSNYSDDIAVIDDTAMTNMYGLPVEAIIVNDQEDHSQLLGYSNIPNKSENSFTNCFKDYLSLGGKHFRIIIVDHLEA